VFLFLGLQLGKVGLQGENQRHPSEVEARTKEVADPAQPGEVRFAVAAGSARGAVGLEQTTVSYRRSV